jgi:hypothetical protein
MQITLMDNTPPGGSAFFTPSMAKQKKRQRNQKEKLDVNLRQRRLRRWER